MTLQNKIDDPTTVRKAAKQQRWAIRIRHIVYLQLFSLIPSILIGRCEQWGYAAVLERGILGIIFGPLAVAISWSAIIFPIAILVALQHENPPPKWSWVAAPLSILMSFIQILALLPLFQ